MHFDYLFGGLSIRSDHFIGQLRSGAHETSPAILLNRTELPVPAQDSVARWGGRYRLTVGRAGADWVFGSRFDGVFRFDQAAHRIDIHAADPAADEWRDVLVRRVLPRVVARYGATPIHAAAVATPAGAALLVGASGAGKSTLTAALGQHGWDVLSDDIAIVWSGNPPQVAPVQRGVVIWEASRIALGIDASACRALPGYGGDKAQFLSGNDTDTRARSLEAIIVLERSQAVIAPELTALPFAEALRAVARQEITFFPTVTPGAETAAGFGRLTAIVRGATCYRLRYPDNFSALPQVERTLRALLAGLIRQ